MITVAGSIPAAVAKQPWPLWPVKTLGKYGSFALPWPLYGPLRRNDLRHQGRGGVAVNPYPTTTYNYFEKLSLITKEFP